MNYDRLPRHTCPLIDIVIEGLSEELLPAEIHKIKSIMEDIRNANSTLRDAAKEAREDAERLENERDEAQAEAGRLQIELDEANKELLALDKLLKEAQAALEASAE